MSDFMNALDKEIQGLERALEANADYQKLTHLREVRSLYAPNNDEHENRSGNTRSQTRQPSEARAFAIELAEMFLRNRSGPTPTREILAHIEGAGGEIGGRDPISNLSAMLSNTGRFQSNGRAGWTLNLLNSSESLSKQVVRAIASNAFTKIPEHRLEEFKLSLETDDELHPDLKAALRDAARDMVGSYDLADSEIDRIKREFATHFVDIFS